MRRKRSCIVEQLYIRFSFPIQTDTLVVWKEFAITGVGDKVKREVKNEIEILSVLSHPNIIAYYTHFFGEKDIFIEMEYANGDFSS